MVIPPGVHIGFDLEADRKRFTVTDNGIVVIPKRATLESGLTAEMDDDDAYDASYDQKGA